MSVRVGVPRLRPIDVAISWPENPWAARRRAARASGSTEASALWSSRLALGAEVPALRPLGLAALEEPR